MFKFVEIVTSALGVLYLIMFMYGLVMIYQAAATLRKDPEEGMKGIIGAIFLVAGPLILRFLFSEFQIDTGMLFGAR